MGSKRGEWDVTQGGLTLTEVLVATALTLVVFVIALGLLDLLRRSFERTRLAADARARMQLALESMGRDLRGAGRAIDPDAAPGRPDEAVEGAWAGALVVRGDYDAGDPARQNDPEAWIAGAFPSTRTGNDEIVAYALRSESGSAGLDLSFDADVAHPAPILTPAGDWVAPRDGLVEAVTLSRTLGSDGGPVGAGAILYRARLSTNALTWGTGNAVIWQPVVDGVARLAIRYLDVDGNAIDPPGGAESGRDLRARIAQVEIRIVVLEKRPDGDWTDPTDTNPGTVHMRKMDELLRVSLRNG